MPGALCKRLVIALLASPLSILRERPGDCALAAGAGLLRLILHGALSENLPVATPSVLMPVMPGDGSADAAAGPVDPKPGQVCVAVTATVADVTGSSAPSHRPSRSRTRCRHRYHQDRQQRDQRPNRRTKHEVSSLCGS